MARRWYLEADSGKETLWTDDGITFYALGTSAVFARRDADRLTLTDGRLLALVSPEDDRLLLDPDGFPVAVEHGLYESMMGRDTVAGPADSAEGVLGGDYFKSVVSRYPGWKRAGSQLHLRSGDDHWAQLYVEGFVFRGGLQFDLTSGACSPYLLKVINGWDPSKRPKLGIATSHAVTSAQVAVEVREGSDGDASEFDPAKRYWPMSVSVSPADVHGWIDSYLAVVIPELETLIDDEAMLAWHLDEEGWRRRGGVRSHNSLRLASILAKHLGRTEEMQLALDLLSADDTMREGAESLAPDYPMAFSTTKFVSWLSTLDT